MGIIHRTPEVTWLLKKTSFLFYKLLLKPTCVCCLCSRSWSQRWFISCEVEKVVDKRTRNGEVQYCVKWKGYTNQHNTWCSMPDLSCDELIQHYEQSLQNPKSKQGR